MILFYIYKNIPPVPTFGIGGTADSVTTEYGRVVTGYFNPE